MKSTFIAWTRYNRRSDLLAHHFGATMHHIFRGQHGKLLQAPARYAFQALETWQVLRRERPDVIWVQNPPIFSVLVAATYCRLFGAQYIIDSHTAAFLSPKWRWLLWLHRVLSRRAVTTIVTNSELERMVQGWGCEAFILGFTPADYPEGVPFPLPPGFNVAVVSTGAEDEPLDVVFGAAGQLPQINFYITGDMGRLNNRLLLSKPANCRFTGYLAYDNYVGLLRGVDIVVDLTTRNHTLLLGAFEAVSLGTPLIVSDWPVLKDYFSRGAVYVPNTTDGLRDGLLRAQQDYIELRRNVVALKEELHREWDRKYAELESLLATG